MAGEVVLDLFEALVADPDPRAVGEHELAPEPAADEEAGRVAGPGREPGDRDQQVDVDRALAGDGAAEQHHGLAGDDEADEGAGLGEGEDADQEVGPGAERVGEVFQQALQVEVAELAAEQVVAERDRRGDDRDQQAFAVAAAAPLARQLHGALPASQTIASSRSSASAAARAAARSGKRPKAVGPEPVSRACGAPAARSASSASPMSGRSERAPARGR